MASGVDLGVVVVAEDVVAETAAAPICVAVLVRTSAACVGAVLEGSGLDVAEDAVVRAAVRIVEEIAEASAGLVGVFVAFLQLLVGCRWEGSAYMHSLVAAVGEVARLAYVQDAVEA